MKAHARGLQIYTCKAVEGRFEWTLKAPDAQLFDERGRPIGKHFAGPAWRAQDGSQVTGRAIASEPSPDRDSVPWLLVSAIKHDGDGLFSRVSVIQRLNTSRGKAPAEGCNPSHEGAETSAPYEADYFFYETSK